MEQHDLWILYENIKFKSTWDEHIFFTWLSKISCFSHYEWYRMEIYVYLKTEHISDNDLLNLIGLFKRFEVEDIEQLEFFKTEQNKHIFEMHIPSPHTDQ
jgi:hypothetical protein